MVGKTREEALITGCSDRKGVSVFQQLTGTC